MSDLVKGKVALVTGASSGIGRATALEFAKNGAKVIVADIMKEEGEQTVSMIEKSGGEGYFTKCDVSESLDVRNTLEKAVDEFGKLDCACNNAGVEGPMGPLTELEEDDWEKVININLKGTWLCMKYEIPKMLESGGGAIVNVSSVAGLVGYRGLSAYVASKFGINGLTKTAALEYAKSNIRINSVCPGVIHTAMVDRIVEENPELEEELASSAPIGRMGEPEEIAKTIVWLCSDKASFITGHTAVADGGFIAR